MKKAIIILARGGSKGILRKNLLEYNGKPLIAHVITAGKDFQDDVFVSTDDDEIGDISQQFGASIIKQPSEVSGDFSTDLEAFSFVLKQPIIENLNLDYVIHLRATYPDVTGQLIRTAVELFENSYQHYDSLRSVERSVQTPYKTWFINGEGSLSPVIPGNELHSTQRQCLPVTYWQNAAIDMFKVNNVLKKYSMVGDSIMPFIMNGGGIDIDTWDDYKRLKRSR